MVDMETNHSEENIGELTCVGRDTIARPRDAASKFHKTGHVNRESRFIGRNRNNAHDIEQVAVIAAPYAGMATSGCACMEA